MRMFKLTASPYDTSIAIGALSSLGLSCHVQFGDIMESTPFIADFDDNCISKDSFIAFMNHLHRLTDDFNTDKFCVEVQNGNLIKRIYVIGGSEIDYENLF